MLGIGCDYCAYCFDEALFAVDIFAQHKANKDAELKAELDATHQQTMSS